MKTYTTIQTEIKRNEMNDCILEMLTEKYGKENIYKVGNNEYSIRVINKEDSEDYPQCDKFINITTTIKTDISDSDNSMRPYDGKEAQFNYFNNKREILENQITKKNEKIDEKLQQLADYKQEVIDLMNKLNDLTSFINSIK